MIFQRSITVGNAGYSVNVPDACPICHRHSETEFIKAAVVQPKNEVQAIFRCAFQECRVFFICTYGATPSTELLSTSPVKPIDSIFPENISNLSPSFVSIFREANEAKHLNLKQIAGPGFRKAFEFLIKDYAKSLDPANAHAVEKTAAGNVVNNFISDTRIQAVAKRSLWLGNDETHYLRKWADHDIEDLVKLIKLATHWIEIDHGSKAYIDDMPG